MKKIILVVNLLFIIILSGCSFRSTGVITGDETVSTAAENTKMARIGAGQKVGGNGGDRAGADHGDGIAVRHKVQTARFRVEQQNAALMGGQPFFVVAVKYRDDLGAEIVAVPQIGGHKAEDVVMGQGGHRPQILQAFAGRIVRKGPAHQGDAGGNGQLFDDLGFVQLFHKSPPLGKSVFIVLRKDGRNKGEILIFSAVRGNMEKETLKLLAAF